ncbi:MAG: hypothetical protein M1819_002690 [Sarea resinae]|nr:MAG: hypothetical protein M1819_002690 [Sarea resinae]
MSPEPGSNQRSASPASSGRSSPVNRPSRARLEDVLYKKDKSYRRYASGIERALSLFDTALQEWADYISFLGRLLKALQAHPSTVAVVPHKATVAKRLAQCLNPSLPSGVHQKALEVYGYIFSLIGRDTLSRDLPLYFPGLSSTLSFASLSVRPAFLSLLESHLLQLDPNALHPALKAIILTLLPGLEEETSDDFERTLGILDGFRAAISSPVRREKTSLSDDSGDAFFWQCFFLASITSPSRRQGALAFLNRKLPKLGSTPANAATKKKTAHGEELNGHDTNSIASKAVVSPEPGLLIRCLAAGLSDEQILIQRGFLDLLVTHLPLNSPVLHQNVTPEDLERLVAAAAGVVARRDMSLNRRLWTWLLGPENISAGDEEALLGASQSPDANGSLPLNERVGSVRSQYFSQYGLQPLVHSIHNMVKRDASSSTERARPFRICLSLMDRWEVGGLLVPEIFMPAIENVRQYKEIASSTEEFNEVLRSASVFFDGVESGLIWGELVGVIASALSDEESSPQSRLDKLLLVQFVITHFNVREEEMLIIHMPMVALALLVMIRQTDSRERMKPGNFSQRILSLSLAIAHDLTEMIPERAFLMESSAAGSVPLGRQGHEWTLSNSEILGSIREFYVNDQGNLDASSPPFSTRDVVELLLREVASLLCQELRSQSAFVTIDVRTKLMISLLRKAPRGNAFNSTALLSSFHQVLDAHSGSSRRDESFAVFSAITGALTAFPSSDKVHLYFSATQISELIPKLVRQAWVHLSPAHPKYHVETVRCLWQLQSVSPLNRDIEASISTLMVENYTEGNTSAMASDAGRRFSVLWTHSVQSQDKALQILQSSDGSAQNGKATTTISSYETMLTRPMFLLLDTLAEEGTELFPFVKEWLQTLPSVDKVLNILALKVQAFEVQQAILTTNTMTDEASDFCDPIEYTDVEEQYYYFQTLSNILKWSSSSTWASLANQKASEMSGEEQGSGKGAISLQVFFVRACMRILDTSFATTDSGFLYLASRLRCSALSVLQQILLGPYPMQLEGLDLENVLIDKLIACISRSYEELKDSFRGGHSEREVAPESTIVALLNGLEHTLAGAHDRLISEEYKRQGTKSPDQPQGFFGNLVSGVINAETHQTRSATANNRLTVLLSFQDSVGICFTIWSWGGYGSINASQDAASAASFNYISLRVRNRARRILEHLFSAEALECLEALGVLWRNAMVAKGSSQAASVFDLLHVLDGSRPKNTIPAIFDAIYSRTNPSVLDSSRKSTLTSDLTEVDIMAFLVQYAQSLEDDTMDEIWTDCMTFLRDVLANPFPHRQILPKLLEFTAILGEKADNTNFGEQRKLRRELADLFVRLLTATFTTKPMGFSQEGPTPALHEKAQLDGEQPGQSLDSYQLVKSDDITTILTSIVPKLPQVILEHDRIVAAISTISTNVIVPTFRSRSFPDNVTKNILDLLYQLARIPDAAKTWRRDIAEAFNDARFFSFPLSLVQGNWLPLLRQWALSDKDRMPELLSRLSAPTTAGIMFGVGASSARLEADRRTQLNLRRIALLVLAATEDNFVANLSSLQEKLVELMAATAATSPSSATRAEIFLVVRSLVLKVSPIHLAPLWPIITSELQAALSSIVPDTTNSATDVYNNISIFQACKLLDTLLTIAPDEFQLHEWLFVTDTIDAVYRPPGFSPIALVDELAEELGSSSITPTAGINSPRHTPAPSTSFPGFSSPTANAKSTGRRPLLHLSRVPPKIKREDLVAQILRPFFSQLSIWAFESVYGMGAPEREVCVQGLLADLCDEGTIVG